MVIKHLLILGAGDPGAIEHFYIQGFRKCGIAVETYVIADQYYAAINKSIFNKVLNKISADIFYKSINQQLLAFMERKRFDVILVFKGMQLFPETVQLLRQHAALLANYNGDHPFTFYAPGSGNKHVLNSIPYYDVHFSYAGNIVEQLKRMFNKNAYRIPFGYDSNLTVAAAHTTDIYANKVLFIGAFDKERACYLNQLHSEALDIYGDEKWRSRNLFRPYIQRAYKNKALYKSDYVYAVSSSLGVINLLRKQNIIENSHNMRTFEVPGYGGLLISQRTSEQLEFFEEDREAVFFETADELREKLEYLSTNPDKVRAMKQAAYSRSVRSNYSYDQRSKQLIKCLQDNF